MGRRRIPLWLAARHPTTLEAETHRTSLTPVAARVHTAAVAAAPARAVGAGRVWLKRTGMGEQVGGGRVWYVTDVGVHLFNSHQRHRTRVPIDVGQGRRLPS